MFKKKWYFQVEDCSAIDFCKLLGKYGIKFEIGKLRTVAREDDPNRKLYYRVFAVRASNHQAKKLVDELSYKPEF